MEHSLEDSDDIMQCCAKGDLKQDPEEHEHSQMSGVHPQDLVQSEEEYHW